MRSVDDELRIRPAGADDLDAIAAMLEESYRGLVTDDYVDWMARPARWWRTATEVYIAEVDGVVVGCVTLALPDSRLFDTRHPAPADATFRLLAVRPAARGRGVATALVHACLDAARAAGARRIAIHTVETMVAARRLYERLDFTRRPDLDVAYPGGIGLGYAIDLVEDAAAHFPTPGPPPEHPPWHEDVHGEPSTAPTHPRGEDEA